MPAVIVSPWIEKGTIDHRAYDHSSIPKTIENVFGLDSLTDRDKAANSVFPLLTGFDIRTDAPPRLPDFVPPKALPTQIIKPGEDSVNSGTLPVFLHIAMRHDAALSHPDEKQAILQRAQEIRTRAQAAQYIGEISSRLG